MDDDDVFDKYISQIPKLSLVLVFQHLAEWR